MTTTDRNAGSPATLLARQRARRTELALEPSRARIARLRRLEDGLLRHTPGLHAALAEDLGKCAQESDLTELVPALTELRHARRRLRRWMRPRRVSPPLPLLGTRCEVRTEPLGNALILSPWNYPLLLNVGPLISALAAGCTAVLKPSEHAPATARALGELARDCFSPDEVAVLEGRTELAVELLSLDFDHVFFTGSCEVGREVMAAAARGPRSVTLELGGRCPVVVLPGANPVRAAREIVFGRFTNAGQTCVAPNHVLVHRSLLGDLRAALVAEVERVFGASTVERRRAPHFGRIVNARHVERLADWLEQALAAGGELLVGGDHDARERWFEPTVVELPAGRDVGPLGRCEVFGPLLPLHAFDSASQAEQWVAHDAPPLALYLFGSREQTSALGRRVRAGATVIGETIVQFGVPELPFGGIGPSGIGRSHGRAGFEAFSRPRAVLEARPGALAVRALRAPYRSFAARTLDLARRWL